MRKDVIKSTAIESIFNKKSSKMLTTSTQLRVRYGETDPMGYLYYGNYAQFFEVGRVEMIRSLGLSYKEMEDEYGILMPVMSLHIRYIRPALYDDLLTIETTLRQLPNDTITFFVEIFNEKRKLICGGEVKLCFIDQTSKKRLLAPKYLIDRLLIHFCNP